MAVRWRWQAQEQLLLCGMLLKLAPGKERGREKVLHHRTHVLLPLQLHQSFFRWGLASPSPPPHFPWLAVRPRVPAADAISWDATARGTVTSSSCCEPDPIWRKDSSALEVLQGGLGLLAAPQLGFVLPRVSIYHTRLWAEPLPCLVFWLHFLEHE